jgi:hypothetical protein
VVFPKRPYRKLPTLSRATLRNVHVFATNPESTKSLDFLNWVGGPELEQSFLVSGTDSANRLKGRDAKPLA